MDYLDAAAMLAVIFVMMLAAALFAAGLGTGYFLWG